MQLLSYSTTFTIMIPMNIVIVIICFNFKYSESLNCSYIDDNILGMAKWVQVSSTLNQDVNVSSRHFAEQTLPKFCTKAEPVPTLEIFTLFGTSTMELGEELFKNFNLRRFVAAHNNIKSIYSLTFLNISVISINLQHNGVQLIQDEAFKDLKHLENLDLANNELTHINSKMFINLPGLDDFSVAGNWLKSVGPNDLQFLTGRRVLNVNLCCNTLEILQSKSLSNLTLERLFLYSNFLTNFQEDVFQNSCIEYIYVNDNELSQFSENILKQLCNLSVMEYVSNNKLDEQNHKEFDNPIFVTAYILVIILVPIAYFIYSKIYK